MARSLSQRVKIDLDVPIEIEGHTVTALYARRAKRKDLRALTCDALDLQTGLEIAARLCGVPVAAIITLSDTDAERVGRHIERLIEGIV